MIEARAGTSPAGLAHIAPAQLMQRLSRDADYAHWSERFLHGRAR